MALNDEYSVFFGEQSFLSSHFIGIDSECPWRDGKQSGCVITRKIKDFVLGNNERLPQADPDL